MQFPVSGPAAIAFARDFYAAIARDRGVVAAAAAGRSAIGGLGSRTLEWATPALCLRGDVSTYRVLLWETATWTRLRTLEGHTRAVVSVAFSPDGTRRVCQRRRDDPAVGVSRVRSG
jgi:hypothetical protein